MCNQGTRRIGQLCWISAEKNVLKEFTLLGHGDFTKCSNTCEGGCLPFSSTETSAVAWKLLIFSESRTQSQHLVFTTRWTTKAHAQSSCLSYKTMATSVWFGHVQWLNMKS